MEEGLELSAEGSSSGSKRQRLIPCTTTVSDVPKNACVIMSSCPNWHVFILGLNEEGDGNNTFMLRPPNLIFRGLSMCCCFCAVGSLLYIIPPKDTVVYTFKLSSELAKLSDYVVERSALERASDLLSPKRLPIAVAYGTSLLVFNTHIPFFKEKEKEELYDDDDEEEYEEFHNFDSDFELFEPNVCSVKLPPLLVKEKWHPNAEMPWLHSKFEFHPTSESWSYHCDFTSAFAITNFAFIDMHSFLVQTAMGKTFSLRIDKPSEGWKLLGGLKLFGGVEQNFVVTHNQTKFVLDAYGAAIFDPKPCDSVSHVYFPVSPFGNSLHPGFSSVIALNDTSKYVCIVHVGADSIEFPRPHWILDFIRLDFDKYGDETKFGRRMMSLKFYVNKCCPDYDVMALIMF